MDLSMNSSNTNGSTGGKADARSSNNRARPREESASKTSALAQLEQKFGFPTGSVRCFDIDPSQSLGLVTLDPRGKDLGSRSLLDLWVVKNVHPGSQAEKAGITARDAIYKIGRRLITLHDDLKALVAAERQHALDQNTTYQLITFPGKEVQMQQSRNQPQSQSADQQPSLSATTSNATGNAISVAAMADTNQQTNESSKGDSGKEIAELEHSLIPTSTGTGVRSVRFKHIRLTCVERIEHVNSKYYLLDPGIVYAATNELDPANPFDFVIQSLIADAPYTADHFVGAKTQLKGPQPWMLTRRFIVYKLDEWHKINKSDWMASAKRLKLLQNQYLPIIASYIKTAMPTYASIPWFMEQYPKKISKKIWALFLSENKCEARDLFIRSKITEREVLAILRKLTATGKLPESPPASLETETDDAIRKLRTNLDKFIAAMRFDVLPLADDWDEIVSTLIYHFYNSFEKRSSLSVTHEVVREALDDLEDECDFLSYHNQLFKATLKLSCAPPKRLDIEKNSSANTTISTKSDESSTVVGAHYSRKRKANKSVRALSGIREVGSRVYAEFTNNQYYWGVIEKVGTKNRLPCYSVRYDDGDRLSGVPAEKLYTEAEYRVAFGRVPPLLPQDELLQTPPDAQGDSDSLASLVDTPDTSEESDPRDPRELTKRLKARPALTARSCSDPMNLEELYENRCGECALCIRQDCEHCSSCLRNSNGSNNRKEVCFRKMCCRISAKAKAQPALGFPPGFKFLFDEPGKANFRAIPHSETLAGLKFFTPNGRTLSLASVGASKGVTQEMIDSFLSCVGVAYRDSKHHFLVGKGYRHEWTDVNGVNKVAFGKILSCSTDWNGGFKNETFTVEFNDESCKVAEEFSSYPASIFRTQEIPQNSAFGGFVSFERDLQKGQRGVEPLSSLDRNAPVMCWRTPDMRKEELLRTNDGTKRPKLTLVFRGWRLEFSVRPSTIENAGLGCFVRCTRVFGGTSDYGTDGFVLQPGEMLDLGVYAPFREEDKKPLLLFKLKNYVHSFAPEEWCFGSPDDKFQYDITDETTGETHHIAQQHICMYVNETHDTSRQTIHAEYDPEGFVHYLFGVGYDGDSDAFNEEMQRLSADIRKGEFEVFIDYGAEYEKVRKRKGYSLLTAEGEDAHLNTTKQDEKEFLDEIKEFEKDDIRMVLEYFSGPFFVDSRGIRVEGPSLNAKGRLLTVLHRIQRRLDYLMYVRNPECPDMQYLDEQHLLLTLRENILSTL